MVSKKLKHSLLRSSSSSWDLFNAGLTFFLVETVSFSNSLDLLRDITARSWRLQVQLIYLGPSAEKYSSLSKKLAQNFKQFLPILYRNLCAKLRLKLGSIFKLTGLLTYATWNTCWNVSCFSERFGSIKFIIQGAKDLIVQKKNLRRIPSHRSKLKTQRKTKSSSCSKNMSPNSLMTVWISILIFQKKIQTFSHMAWVLRLLWETKNWLKSLKKQSKEWTLCLRARRRNMTPATIKLKQWASWPNTRWFLSKLRSTWWIWHQFSIARHNPMLRSYFRRSNSMPVSEERTEPVLP